MWIPFLWVNPITLVSHPYLPVQFLSFFFFGGLSIPLTQAIFAHFFSYNITWSATVKEVQRSNFFKEIPKIVKRWGWRSTASAPANVSISQVLVPPPALHCHHRRYSDMQHNIGAAGMEGRGNLMGRYFPLSVSDVLPRSRVHLADNVLVCIGCKRRVIFCSRWVFLHSGYQTVCWSTLLQIVLNPWLMVFSY